MTPSADRDTGRTGPGAEPIGTAHQVSGPWEKIFGPGGLEAAVGRAEDLFTPEPEPTDGVTANSDPPPEAERADDVRPVEAKQVAGPDPHTAPEEEPTASGASDPEVVEAAAGASVDGASVAGASAAGETEAGDEAEAGDLHRVPVHQHVDGLDPRDAPRGAAASADEPEPDDGLDADPESVARTIVLRKLTAQDRTRAELADALRAKDVPESVADRVLDRMEEVGLVDDARFAESWVRSRQQRRGMSALALRRELHRKGVDPELSDAALAQVDPDDEYTAAVALAEKKFRTMGDLAPEVAKRRLAGALARRGFSSGLVWRVVREVLGEAR